MMRPFELGDAAEAWGWFGDPEVMRFIPSGADRTLEETLARIDRYRAHQAQHGFGKWVIVDKATGRLIGDAGLTFLPDGQRVELGYRLARSCWGRGLAEEVGRRWIEVAPDFTGKPELHGFAHPDHVASLHVLRKLGFVFLRQESCYGWDVPMHVLGLVTDGIPQSRVSL